MAILKSEILEHLNKELKRTETNIDDHILSAMKRLSITDDFCWIEAITVLEVGKPYYTLPTDFRKLMTITLDNGRPLKKGSFRGYQQRLGIYSGDRRGLPIAFAIHGGFWYPYPIPDKPYEATLFYNAHVLESEPDEEGDRIMAVDNIGRYFTEIFRDALNTLTKMYYCMSKELKEDTATYLSIFTGVDLPPLQAMVEREIRTLAYRDLY